MDRGSFMLGRSGGIEEDTEEKAKAVAAAWVTELKVFKTCKFGNKVEALFFWGIQTK